MKEYITPATRVVIRLAQEAFCTSNGGTTENYNEMNVDWDD